MTRRSALLRGLGYPLGILALPPAAFAKDFWNDRKPEDWSSAEIKELLTKSPWARDASITDNGQVGGMGNARGAATRRTRSGTGQAGGTESTPAAKIQWKAIVRWESALPVREASHSASKDDPAANYILSVTGDIPMLGGAGNDETESEFQQRLEMLKEYSKLEKRGDPIYLVKIGRLKGPVAKSGTLFYFERNDLIRLNDHQVTFVTKLGPLTVKCKFPLHDMLYQGKLEL